MCYYIEPFDQKKHMHLLCLMEFSKESRMELRASPLVGMGLGPAEILYDCVCGSAESFVIRDRQTRRIRGVFGCANGVDHVSPWFLSDGFEREPENLRQFMKDSVLYMKHFKALCPPHKDMLNFCLDDSRITRWLRWLGFTVGPPMTVNGVRMCPFKLERRLNRCAHQQLGLSSA